MWWRVRLQTSYLHIEEVNPEVRFLLSLKPERLGSVFVSSSLLDSSGLEEDDDEGRESKRYELQDESNVSFDESAVPVQEREDK